jgi:HEAT repeat protein
MTADAADLLRGEPAERLAAMTALLASGRPATAAEREALLANLDDAGKRVQRAAAETLTGLVDRNPEIAGRLAALLSAASERQRWGAVYALSRLGPLPLDALDTLIDVIGCDDGDRRWAAAELLLRMAVDHASPVIPRLLAAARQGVAEARKMALYCLRDLGVREACAVAEEALRHEDLGVRLAALSAVSRLTDDRAGSARGVARLIDDPDARMRRAAAATLGTLGVTTPDVVDALRRALASDDASLRRAATQALARLNPP